MRFLVSILAVISVGCGSSASEGSPCTTPNAIECSGAKSMLVCEGTKWAAYACPSCSSNKCDWKGVTTGSGCPQIADTYGSCNYDGRLVGCFWSTAADAGVFVESACPACMAGKSIEELGKCSGGRCSCQ